MKTESTPLQVVLFNGLSEQQMKFALELASKHPSISREAKSVLAAEGEIKDKYFNLCDEIRKSGLNARELTLILQAEGFHKVRISEIKRVVSVDDDTWEKYRRKDFGFKATLKIARDGSQNVAEAGDVGGESSGEGSESGSASPKPPTVVPVSSLIGDPKFGPIKKAIVKAQFAPGKYTALVEEGGVAIQVLFTVRQVTA